MDEGAEMTSQERAALALWLILQRPHTTATLAHRLGLSCEGARVMLFQISRVVPIFYTKQDGFWKIVPKS